MKGLRTRRTRQIKIRLTSGEHSSLMAKRGHMRLASWVRESCLRGIPPTIPPINRQAMAELHRIGSNLNQIARSVQFGSSPDLIDLREQVSALRSIRSTLAGAAPVGAAK